MRTSSSPRLLSTSLALALCGCAGFGGGDSDGGDCRPRLSGTVTAPNGADPMPGARVYLAARTPPPRPDVVRCELCGSADQVPVLASTFSGIDGSFTLDLPPNTADAQLYVEKGRFRRRVPFTATLVFGDVCVSVAAVLIALAAGVGVGRRAAVPATSGEQHGEEKGEKLTVFKYRRRKGYRRKTGHRQQYTAVQIDDIKA